MATPPPSARRLVQLAEIERRAGLPPAARAAIEQAKQVTRRDASEAALIALAEAYLEWWTPEALEHYAEVERIGRSLDDPICTGLGVLGRIRCARFRVEEVAPTLFDEASELLGGDRCAYADLQRERSAHHLLADRHDLARRCALTALDTHEEFGDEVLAAYAELLLGRADRETGADRFQRLRDAYARADRAGATDVAADVALFLVPTLARGQSPGSPLLREALSIADRVADHKREFDAFGSAELDIQLAGILTLSDPAGAEAHASRALAYFTFIGNQLGIASANKALARIEARRLRIVWQGSWIRGARSSPRGLGRVMRRYARARRSYRAAGMELAAQRVSIEQSLIRTYELGLPLSVEAVADLKAGLPRSDRFTDAKLAVLDGLATMHDEPEIALRAFERAAEISSALDASDLESVAHVGIAATNRRLGDLAAAGTATRRFIENAERLRVSVQDPHVASDMAAIAEEPYRFALRVAVESGDALLALRVVERMRTERLASLFAARTRHSPRPDLEEVIDRLATLDREDAGQRRGELLAELASLTNKYFAEFYAPTTLAIDELVSQLPARDFVLAQDLAGVEGPSPELISIWRAPGSDWQVERRVLSAEAADSVRALASGRGAERELMLDDLSQLADLVPTGLGTAIIDGGSGRLRIVPSGVLWTVPYLVVPVSAASSRLLVELADVSLLPSLRLLAAARTRHQRTKDGPVLSWLSPELDSQRGELAPFDDHGLIEATTPPEFLDIMTRPHDISMAIITSHCNDAPGLAQSATLGGRPVLTAADLLALGRVPPIVSIAGCHGLNASGAGHEQLGLTTAAICGGADEVVSSHLELATSAITTVALLRVYRRLISGARADAAVSSVVRELLQGADRTKTPLAVWGALNVVSVRS